MRSPLLLAALTLLAAVARFLRLTASGEPPGTDGYYYVVQAETWAELGHLHVPDASWMLLLPGMLVRAGLDPVIAVTVVSAGLAAAIVPAAFVLGRAAGGSERGAWALALWAACSPTLMLLASEFPKNLAFVAPALLALAAAAALGQRWRVDVAVAGLVAALAAATAHRLGAAFLLLVGAGAVVALLGSRWRQTDPTLRKRVGLALVAGVGARLRDRAPPARRSRDPRSPGLWRWQALVGAVGGRCSASTGQRPGAAAGSTRRARSG